MFEIGAEYTRDDIHAQYGGSKQAYLPTVAGKVVAICVTPELYPLAPQVILCGQGPRIAPTGAQLAQQTGPVPVFVKRGVNRWEYRGLMRVLAAYTGGPRFESLVAGSRRNPQEISLVVEMA